jgi:hypothetical protein
MDAVKRFGLGSRQGNVMAEEEREFHAQSPGYLFFTCSLQAMAPAVVLTWTGNALARDLLGAAGDQEEISANRG